MSALDLDPGRMHHARKCKRPALVSRPALTRADYTVWRCPSCGAVAVVRDDAEPTEPDTEP